MILKKPWILLIIAVAFLFCFFGLYWRTESQRTLQLARTLRTKNSPERIVSLAPNLTEILFALGLEGKIVGVTLHCDYPLAAAAKPKVGTFWQPNIEAVIAVKPDLIVSPGSGQQRSFTERLERAGLNCLTVNTATISELFETIGGIGMATGKQDEANQLVSDMQKKLIELAALAGKQDKVKVLLVVQREPLRVAGRETFVNEIIEFAGGENAIGQTIYKYHPIGAEKVIASGPDVIIEPSMTKEDVSSQQESAIRYWNKFENLPAVINHRIYVINGDIVSRLGPRLCEGVETIAKYLHPELFRD